MNKELEIMVTLGWHAYTLNASIEVIEALQKMVTVETSYLNGKNYVFPAERQDQIQISLVGNFVRVDRAKMLRLDEAERSRLAKLRAEKAELAEQQAELAEAEGP